MNQPRHARETTSYKFASSSLAISHEEKNVTRDGSKGPEKLYKKCRGGEGIKGMREKCEDLGKWMRQKKRGGSE